MSGCARSVTGWLHGAPRPSKQGTIVEVAVGPGFGHPTPINWDGATGNFGDGGDFVGGIVPGKTDTVGFPFGDTLEGTGTCDAYRAVIRRDGAAAAFC